MNDDFKQDILQQLEAIESAIDELNNALAQDTNMSIKKWTDYDAKTSKIYGLLQHLKEDIFFT